MTKKTKQKQPRQKHTQAQMNIIFKICAQAQANNKPLKRTTEAQIIAYGKKPKPYRIKIMEKKHTQAQMIACKKKITHKPK